MFNPRIAVLGVVMCCTAGFAQTSSVPSANTPEDARHNAPTWKQQGNPNANGNLSGHHKTSHKKTAGTDSSMATPDGSMSSGKPGAVSAPDKMGHATDRTGSGVTPVSNSPKVAQ